MDSKIFKKKLREWRKNNQENIQIIELDKIDVFYKIHQRAESVNLGGKMEGMVNSNRTLSDKIVVKKSANGRYRLLFGMSNLIRLKLLNVKENGVIVTEYTRNELKDIIKNQD